MTLQGVTRNSYHLFTEGDHAEGSLLSRSRQLHQARMLLEEQVKLLWCCSFAAGSYVPGTQVHELQGALQNTVKVLVDVVNDSKRRTRV